MQGLQCMPTYQVRSNSTVISTTIDCFSIFLGLGNFLNMKLNLIFTHNYIFQQFVLTVLHRPVPRHIFSKEADIFSHKK